MKKDKYIALCLLCAIATSNLSAVTVFAQDAQTILTQATTVTDQTSEKAGENSSAEATSASESVSSEATTVVPEASLPSTDLHAQPADSTTAPTETVTEEPTETNPTTSPDKQFLQQVIPKEKHRLGRKQIQANPKLQLLVSL
ncbi:hypothetical protein SAG0135_00010 [Streptococcus agalactiae LMG 14609]|uniref:hypothetical protein n=1 Tax=Streptococcus agalactiae TaxID=1311 RepID=UPI0002BC1BF1|nr:hypothetical protein SAG0135_00010 [Streptococcus agalactiae LMG 14609]